MFAVVYPNSELRRLTLSAYLAQGVVNTTTGATGPIPSYEASCESYSDGYTSFYGAGLLNVYAAATAVKVSSAQQMLWHAQKYPSLRESHRRTAC